MSVALTITDESAEASSRQIPVATQKLFNARWLPGARQLGLGWVELMETGFDVTSENRDALVDELQRLRRWMVTQPSHAYDVERLDRLVAELRQLRFAPNIRAFIG
jgi:hypothetical protein